MVFKVPQNPVLIIEAPILSHDPSGAAGSAHIHRHTHTHTHAAKLPRPPKVGKIMAENL